MNSAICLCFAIVLLSTEVIASQIFYESFEEPWKDRWITSEKADYTGTWKHEKSMGHEDYGLLVSEKARKYGIVTELREPIKQENTLVLQYDLRLQNGLECGGAYLKFLPPQEAGWSPKQFDNESPYSVMFGPDKCGATNKVHFIFRHKNPKTGAYVEHHLKNPPSPIVDKFTHVYSAVIYPNNSVKILIDGIEKKTADLLSTEFEPPVVPSKTIPDPNDVKPEEWDERPEIPDPDAKKPEDWDEQAPMEIQDMDAEKPEGWLENEPEEIEDPEAVKPEDWEDEEDGVWEAPKIPNPLCEEAPGCGEWRRPMKRNPTYKGKWQAPMIDNPSYKGIWKPQQIPNPDYFDIDKLKLQPIATIGIEIWTMQDGILFDNILITDDETEAAEYRQKTWKVKFDAETKEEKIKSSDDGDAKKRLFNLARGAANVPFLAGYKTQLNDLIDHAEKNSTISLGLLSVTVLLLLYILYKLLCRTSPYVEPVSVERAKKEDITPADDVTGKSVLTAEDIPKDEVEPSSGPSGGVELDDKSGPRHRRQETRN